MAAPFKFKLNIDRSKLDRLAAADGYLPKTMVKGISRIFIAVGDAISEEVGGSSLSGLRRQTGALVRSWKVQGKGEAETEIKVTKTGANGWIGSRLVYAAIHEYGGVIRAKNHPYLTFPIMERRGAKGRRTLAGWVRVKSVMIPARYYVSYAAQSVDKDASAIMDAALQETIDKLDMQAGSKGGGQ